MTHLAVQIVNLSLRWSTDVDVASVNGANKA